MELKDILDLGVSGVLAVGGWLMWGELRRFIQSNQDLLKQLITFVLEAKDEREQLKQEVRTLRAQLGMETPPPDIRDRFKRSPGDTRPKRP